MAKGRLKADPSRKNVRKRNGEATEGDLERCPTICFYTEALFVVESDRDMVWDIVSSVIEA